MTSITIHWPELVTWLHPTKKDWEVQSYHMLGKRVRESKYLVSKTNCNHGSEFFKAPYWWQDQIYYPMHQLSSPSHPFSSQLSSYQPLRTYVLVMLNYLQLLRKWHCCCMHAWLCTYYSICFSGTRKLFVFPVLSQNTSSLWSLSWLHPDFLPHLVYTVPSLK